MACWHPNPAFHGIGPDACPRAKAATDRVR